MKIATFESLIEQKNLTPIYMVVATGNNVKWFLCIDQQTGTPILFDNEGRAYKPQQFPTINEDTEFSITTQNGQHSVNGHLFYPFPLYNL